jgi:hypothetical protein
VCKNYCSADATFSAQADPLTEIQSLEQYAEWMKGLLTLMPDAEYEIKSFATDEERNIDHADLQYTCLNNRHGFKCHGKLDRTPPSVGE